MRRVLRGAAALLAAATALGLARTAALSAPPVPPGPATAGAPESPDDGPPLPRVVPRSVPPRRPELSPLTDASIEAASGVSTPTTKPAVDLLTPPPLPPAWSQQPNPTPLAVAPSGLPAQPTVTYDAAPRPAFPLLAKFFRPSPQAATNPYADAVLGRMTPAPAVTPPQTAPSTDPAGVAASAGPALPPSTPAAPAARVWPPAFAKPGEVHAPDTQSASFVEKPQEQAVKAPPAAAPVHPGALKQRVEAACGREAMNVVVTTQSDGNLEVKVRVRNAAVEPQVAGKVLELPEMRAPTVHLVMEVEP